MSKRDIHSKLVFSLDQNHCYNDQMKNLKYFMGVIAGVFLIHSSAMAVSLKINNALPAKIQGKGAYYSFFFYNHSIYVDFPAGTIARSHALEFPTKSSPFTLKVYRRLESGSFEQELLCSGVINPVSDGKGSRKYTYTMDNNSKCIFAEDKPATEDTVYVKVLPKNGN